MNSPWRGAGSEYATVSVSKVIAAALRKVQRLGIVKTSTRAVVLHDADITDGEEMSDWVLRIVDLDGLGLS